MNNFIKTIIGDKKRYNEYKASKKELPTPFRDALDALEKYMWGFARGDGFMAVLEDILSLFQEAAADGRTVTDILGPDPVAFADAIMSEYPEELWIIKSQNKLREQIQKINQ